MLEAVLRIDDIRDEIDPDSAGKSYEGTFTNPAAKSGGKAKEWQEVHLIWLPTADGLTIERIARVWIPF